MKYDVNLLCVKIKPLEYHAGSLGRHVFCQYLSLQEPELYT